MLKNLFNDTKILVNPYATGSLLEGFYCWIFQEVLVADHNKSCAASGCMSFLAGPKKARKIKKTQTTQHSMG